MTGMQTEALAIIQAQAGIGIGWLAAQLGTSPQATGRIVSQLSRRDLVSRERGVDDEWVMRANEGTQGGAR